MFQKLQLARPSSSFRGCLKALEADIHHANTLADAVQRAYGGACLQMRISYSPLAPFFLYLLQWMDCAGGGGCTYSLPSYFGLLHVLICKVYVDGKTRISTYERRASLREFYAVIYPSLQQIESNLVEDEDCKYGSRGREIPGRRLDMERENECGICLEICTKMVLPNCNHAMCLNCYRDWNIRSQSCPFCRGSIKRVQSRDLWVLTNNSDVVDTETLEKENLRRFYRFIDKLPLTIPDTLFWVYYDYLV
ncbi:uncharacterized protein M6B38_164470 [Iris pallida]|uniref:RING-type domain-containing protein n=1 Tax=Iris pallida TaxID=29817 RepID=A0AAX6EXQ2_IRIPA|nr:uncharacterized protein M6B38_164470 [Iris pallida]